MPVQHRELFNGQLMVVAPSRNLYLCKCRIDYRDIVIFANTCPYVDADANIRQKT